MTDSPYSPDKPSRKRLVRDPQGPVAGVCGGLASYAGIDPTIVRVLAVVGMLLTLPVGPLIYLALIFVMPKH